ncbi:MAG: ATP-binding cassette domain-containing protein [Eubacteriales bacterium]|jgi:putative ABC transport system permease protein
MLRLKNIRKDYIVGDTIVHALRGVSIELRKNEFVAVLGPSGCGKTTLLNIIGGLDRYTEGELSVSGRSTEKFSDTDWDAYRNYRVGFVFQTYNLIPHQNVLSNVELALTLSGVPKAERQRRAIEALERVGLGDQLKKRPNQLSGGQMQRVAVARALVNNPEIILADEPTGALDTENSITLMEILKEISKDRLIIMVTHNSMLAEKYASRIVKLLDGEIIDDTNPYVSEEVPAEPAVKKARGRSRDEKIKKPSMSFRTALSLSVNNLMTKKTRTFMTSFAGSIGIIGIALILALSNGIQLYINRVQEDALSSYPITLEAETIDLTSLLKILSEKSGGGDTKTDDEPGNYVYVSNVIYDLMNTVNKTATTKNNLTAFKKHIETPDENGKLPLDGSASSIRYEYGTDLNIYVTDKNGDIIKTDTISMIQNMMSSAVGGDSSGLGDFMKMTTSSESLSMYSTLKVWEEMIPPAKDEDTDSLVGGILTEQYDLLYGSWPKSYDEVVLIVDSNNQINDLVLYSLGLLTAKEMYDSFMAIQSGEDAPVDLGPFSFEEICDTTFRLVLPTDYYVYNEATGTYANLADTDIGLSTLYKNGLELKISGIVRPDPDAVATAIGGGIGYTTALTEYIAAETATRDVVKRQLADKETDILTGLPFPDEDVAELTDAEKADAVREYFKGLSAAEKAVAYTEIMSVPSEEHVTSTVEEYMSQMTRETIEAMVAEQYPQYSAVIAEMDDETLYEYVRKAVAERVKEQYSQSVREALGSMTTDQLAAMLNSAELTDEQYAYYYDELMSTGYSKSTYEDNLKLLGYIDKNSPSVIYIYASSFKNKDTIADVIEKYNDSVDEADKISYTDYVKILMSSLTKIINAITYVLVAFVATSLVVSSIMIGIITYISVLERTKEIGILRSIGASKHDISRVFNAETLIIGFGAGIFGIAATFLLMLLINYVIRTLTGIANLKAVLPAEGAVILVIISMVLTLIAGLIPSKIAANKNPVEALRTE